MTLEHGFQSKDVAIDRIYEDAWIVMEGVVGVAFHSASRFEEHR
jgi:hypothetical protein